MPRYQVLRKLRLLNPPNTSLKHGQSSPKRRFPGKTCGGETRSIFATSGLRNRLMLYLCSAWSVVHVLKLREYVQANRQDRGTLFGGFDNNESS